MSEWTVGQNAVLKVECRSRPAYHRMVRILKVTKGKILINLSHTAMELKADGTYSNISNKLDPVFYSLHEATPELVQTVMEEKRVADILKRIGHVQWSTLPVAQIKAIGDVLGI